MPKVSAAEKRAVSRIKPTQLDLFTSPLAHAGNDGIAGTAGAHRAVRAPGGSGSGGDTFNPHGMAQWPCGAWVSGVTGLGGHHAARHAERRA